MRCEATHISLVRPPPSLLAYFLRSSVALAQPKMLFRNLCKLQGRALALVVFSLGSSSLLSFLTRLIFFFLVKQSNLSRQALTFKKVPLPRGEQKLQDEYARIHSRLDSPWNCRNLQKHSRRGLVLLKDHKVLKWQDRGVYRAEVKHSLDNCSSQREYNQLIEFENRDLQIRT